MTKFYWFYQNNSGGNFHVDNNLCHRLAIEADTPEEANEKAEKLGVYFDGCSSGMDCSCCGDRWYEASEYDAKTYPYLYKTSQTGGIIFETVVQHAQRLAYDYGWTKPDCRIFYKDGTIREIFKQER